MAKHHGGHTGKHKTHHGHKTGKIHHRKGHGHHIMAKGKKHHGAHESHHEHNAMHGMHGGFNAPEHYEHGKETGPKNCSYS